jgi:hypothetical protein
MVTKPKKAQRVRAQGATRRPAPSGAARNASAKQATAKHAGVKKAALRKSAPKRAARPGAERKSPKRGAALQPTMPELGGPAAVHGLGEEDQIREAKYLPRELPARLFEEERFVFPESYGVNRIRLLVRDPEWIFAYWDVSPEAMKELARSVGERVFALARLTLRIVDAEGGAASDIQLPPGARWWYVRTDGARRKYRAELGVKLPSGELRRLAWSNPVVTPRVGPSPVAAERRVSYADAEKIPLSAAADAAAEDGRSGLTVSPSSGSLAAGVQPAKPAPAERKGGASDAFRR